MASKTLFTPIASTTIKFDSGPVYGSNGSDFLDLHRHTATSVYTFGGNDFVILDGKADYDVDLGSGNDILIVNGSGAVTADGGSGNDSFIVNEFDNHHFDGGADRDAMTFLGLDHGIRVNFDAGIVGNHPLAPTEFMTIENIEVIHGTDYGDVFSTTDAALDVYAEGGDDKVYGGNAADRVRGGDGDDDIWLGDGDDAGWGGSRHDYIWGGKGDDWISGEDGRDTLSGGLGDDIVLGGDDDDLLSGNAGSDYVDGGDGADYVIGTHHDDQSNDTFKGGNHGAGVNDGVETDADTIDYRYATGSGYFDAELGQVQGEAAGIPIVEQSGPFTITTEFIDTISGFERIIGTDFDDTFRGADDPLVDEWFYGRAGNDRFIASKGDDNFDGDTLPGVGQSVGNDTVDYGNYGGSIELDLAAAFGTARDFASGGEWTHTYRGIENAVGSDFNDILTGDGAANRLEGRGGFDVLTGGAASDTFVFDGDAGDIGYDRVTDFDVEEDILELAGLVRTDGTAIDSFADLDTNGDGVIDGADSTAVSWSGNTALLLQDGVIELQGVSGLTEDDIVFA